MRIGLALLAALLTVLSARPARSVAVRIDAGNAALLFGGSDAEGGVGDWYVSNGVIAAVVDDAGINTDLSGVVPGAEPPINTAASGTGGTLIDLGRVGADDDQLSQMFTVGGLSSSNFVVYRMVWAPAADTIRAAGSLLLPPVSVPPAPCIDLVTDYTAAGGDAFLTITSTATNACAGPVTGLASFLDAFVWTQRSLIPFSGGGAPPAGGRGFNHVALDLANPVAAVETPVFMAAPGVLGPADGVMDPATGRPSGEVAYGLLPMQVEVDADGPGGNPPVVSGVSGLFGVSSTLASALGNLPASVPPSGILPGGSITYRRRVYVGTHNDVRSVADAMLGVLAARSGFGTGTLSGDVAAADTPQVAAGVVAIRLGRCQANPARTCAAAGDCTGAGPCTDPVPTIGFAPGSAVTHVRTDEAGAFAGVVVPAGDYRLTVSAPERDDVVVGPVSVAAGADAMVAIPPLSARGVLRFTVREKVRARPLLPAKLTLWGVAPTPDPRFHRDLAATLSGEDIRPETFGGTQHGPSGNASGQGNVVYTATGEGSIEVRPGTYDVYASRGVEYSLAHARITVPAGGAASADLRLKRVIRARDALSADFHVHSARSFDASAPLRDRVVSFAAEGVEVMVSTDHDKHVDYAPVIAALGLGSRIHAIAGNEVTGEVENPPAFPDSFGHINAWPLPVLPDARRDGAIADEYVAPNWIFKRLREQGARVIQYNHPRAGVAGLGAIGIFNDIGCGRCANAIDTPCTADAECPPTPAPRECTCVGYQPDRPIAMPPNDILLDDGVLGPGSPQNPSLDPRTGDPIRNIDFDVIEIVNAARDTDFPQFRQMRRDWFSLLNQGIVRPGTGVSDSHRLTVEHAGWARTFVYGVGDDPAALDLDVFDGAVRAGRMLVSAGPYVDFAVSGSGGRRVGLGETLTAPTGGSVELRITVLSPAWIPVEEVRVVQNGAVVARYDATTRPRIAPVPADPTRTGRTRRLRVRLPVTLAADAYFVVEAGVKIPADPDTLPTSPPSVDRVEPGVVPLAITNPIFVDLAGDGFDPPGVPLPVAATGFWQRLRARLAGEAVADGAPGSMTGVTRAEKAEAMRRGEYFPLRDFAIPAEVADRFREGREADDAGRQQDDRSAPPSPTR